MSLAANVVAKLIKCAAVVGTALGVCACGHNGVASDELRAVVQRDTVLFANDALPETLLARVAGARVVVFGEYHQDRDHYAFMSALVVALHKQGVRQLLLEWPHAWDWELVAAVQDGSEPDWTPRDPKIGGTLVDAVLRFDRTLPASERISVRAIDANHPGYGGAPDFAYAMKRLALRLADSALLSSALSSYTAQSDDARIQTLAALREDLKASRARYAAAWGETMFSSVLEAIEIELASLPIRARWDGEPDLAFALREDVMKHLCDARLREVDGKTVVNVGQDHAQKSRLRGTRQEWLADYLVHRSPVAAGATQTVAVTPARGEVYVTGTPTSVDITTSSPPNELLRIMSEMAGDQTAFLAVDDPLFEREEVLLSFLSEFQVCAPKRHFDAFVVLPRAHLIQGSAAAARTEEGGQR